LPLIEFRFPQGMPRLGAAHLIALDRGEWFAAAEPRRQTSGVAAGL
jgi:hypothetical protein